MKPSDLILKKLKPGFQLPSNMDTNRHYLPALSHTRSWLCPFALGIGDTMQWAVHQIYHCRLTLKLQISDMVSVAGCLG